jgi:RNA polymerase sigma-70 factor (ECF subfamily)
MEPATQNDSAASEQLVAQARDLVLIEAIVVGNRGAFDELYRAYYTRLMDFLTRMLRRRELAEEVVNDTMYAVWTSSAGFAGRSRVSTWIFGIAYKKALKRLERERRTAADQFEEGFDAPDEREPQHDLNDMQLSRQLDAALNRLTPSHRSVVELTFLMDYSYEETAEIVGCPVNTVKTRMFHARAKLRHLLAACLGRKP